jgi:hypothetical protein
MTVNATASWRVYIPVAGNRSNEPGWVIDAISMLVFSLIVLCIWWVAAVVISARLGI